MTRPPETDEALAALWREVLAGMQKPLREGAGAIDAGTVLRQLADDYVRHPQRWVQLQGDWYQQQLALWTRLCASPDTSGVQQHGGEKGAAPKVDRRFRAPEWQQPYFEWLSQSYLITARWLGAIAEQAELEPHDRKRAAFLMRQWIDAACPANYAWSNPEALKLAAETQGASLAQGLENLRADLPRGMVSMTDERAFEVGRNLAVTPGAVVFANDLMQLIQYRPATPQVYQRPLLMVPPCINKFYVLDLQPDNSLVRYAVEQGHTVFMVSWRNATPEMGGITWDDYVSKGVIAAIDAVRHIGGSQKINALGFCVGGTLLACALAVLRAKRKNPVASLTLLATMLDFSDTGELSVFIDEAYVRNRERQYAAGGLMPGRELALTFASLRANDLIWPYVVNNYLKGRSPPPFDLLHWNCDSTNLPGSMYAWYIRNTYLENNLRMPGKVTVCGVPLDLARLDMPAYLLAAREDHIVPWKTAYASTQLLKGKLQFVLGASGHIAGVINPAKRDKRNYWTGDAGNADAAAWLLAARSQPGSWWKHWRAWLARHAGKRVAAPVAPGNARYPEIEPAPGRYVRQPAPPVAPGLRHSSG